MQPNHGNEQPSGMRCRRAATRNRFYAEIELDCGSMVLKGRVRDLSREGMFIEIAEWPSTDLHFSACLTLATPLPVQCIVRRVALGQGIGVTFVLADDADSRQRLNALLRLLRRAGRPAALVASFPHMHELRCSASAYCADQ
jgi:hypothetical protein